MGAANCCKGDQDENEYNPEGKNVPAVVADGTPAGQHVENQMATKLQANFRGHMARRAVAVKYGFKAHGVEGDDHGYNEQQIQAQQIVSEI